FKQSSAGRIRDIEGPDPARGPYFGDPCARESNYYAIMFDETTDASHKSQMTTILRYLMPDGSVREDFVGFVDLHDQNYQTEINASIDNEPILDRKIIGQSVINMLE